MTAKQPDCREALDWLHCRLDGEQSAMPLTVEAHVARCADCRGRIRAAEKLLAAMARPVDPPARFVIERTIVAVRAMGRQRRTRGWLALVASLAAAVLLAVGIGMMLRRADRPDVEITARQPTLRQELAVAGEAIVGLSKRTASETLGESRLLIPPIELPPSASRVIASAAMPLDQAGKGIAEGLAPVTTSARRAVNLFVGSAPADRKN